MSSAVHSPRCAARSTSTQQRVPCRRCTRAPSTHLSSVKLGLPAATQRSFKASSAVGLVNSLQRSAREHASKSGQSGRGCALQASVHRVRACSAGPGLRAAATGRECGHTEL